MYTINKYITDIKHKHNCIVPYTEIKPTTTTTTTKRVLCALANFDPKTYTLTQNISHLYVNQLFSAEATMYRNSVLSMKI